MELDLTQQQVAHARSLDFVRYVSCLVEEEGLPYSAAKTFAARFPRSLHLSLIEKAGVAVGTTTDATWAGPLAQLRQLTDGFLEFVRPQTIIGRVPGLRRVPFNVSVAAQTGGGTYGWVGQGAVTPATKLTLGSVTLGIAKAAGIITLTRELLRLSTPSAEVLARNDMAAGIAAFLDVAFVDPTKAPVANVSPGSITNGVTPITTAGPTAANAQTDLKALMTAYYATNANAGTLLLSPGNAAALGMALGEADFTSGVYGLTVVTSTAVAGNIILFDPAAVLLADENGLEIDTSKHATVYLDSAPADPPVAASVPTSYWQQGLGGLRAARYINWVRARTTAVVYVAGAAYV